MQTLNRRVDASIKKLSGKIFQPSKNLHNISCESTNQCHSREGGNRNVIPLKIFLETTL